MFRNFFYLPDRALSVREFLWSFCSRFDPRMCTPLFVEERYLGALAAKVAAVLDHPDTGLSRRDVELLYPVFHCRYWMGRNNSVNCQFGPTLTPFVDPVIVAEALALPLSDKNNGRFEADLINTLSPALAAYPSAYGHAFAGPPPLRRVVQDILSTHRPPSCAATPIA
ncbi:MAG: hypothetical protein FJX56_11030 [Alphaproteobacteria bacterium]|nr:hypothetical protein [Alphaproteobacteria bacterium]